MIEHVVDVVCDDQEFVLACQLYDSPAAIYKVDHLQLGEREKKIGGRGMGRERGGISNQGAS